MALILNSVLNKNFNKFGHSVHSQVHVMGHPVSIPSPAFFGLKILSKYLNNSKTFVFLFDLKLNVF